MLFKNLIKKYYLALASSVVVLSSPLAHSEEIALQPGDFFFMKMNPEIAENTSFITLDSNNNNQPLIYPLGFEESIHIQLDLKAPLPLKINVTANTLVLETADSNGESFNIDSASGAVELTGLLTPNLFIFTTGNDNTPTIQLLRVNGENITFSNGDDPNVYIAPPQGITVIFSAGEAPTPVAPNFGDSLPPTSNNPDSGPLNDDPIPDTPPLTQEGSCSLAASGSQTAGFFISLLGISSWMVLRSLRCRRSA